jgi:hypothetical protein
MDKPGIFVISKVNVIVNWKEQRRLDEEKKNGKKL